MKKVKLLLQNPFSDERVTTLRLILFAQNAHAALKDKYPDLAAGLKGNTDRLLNSLGVIGQVSAEGKGSSKALNAYKKKLHAFMKQHNDAFSVALGGRESMAFLSFFPDGVREFSRLTHTEAPAVIERLKKALSDHGAGLPAPIRDSLAPLFDEWNTLRSSQQYLRETVDAKRADRTAERIELELSLLKAVHTVALDHLGDEEGAAKYFDGGLLVGRRRKREEVEQKV